MRKLIMWNVISLDGCFEGEKPWDLSFHGLVWGKELEDVSAKQLASADLLIFGKNTYQGMADYWTKAENDPAEGATAKSMNSIKKIVCSTSLERADWNNTTIVRDAIAEISKLKHEGEGNMFVFGSGNLSESLMNANLFDEYRLVVAPVILGKGRRLFTAGLTHQKLKLLEERTLTSGGVMVRYAPITQ
jgi:dihydrofolate reductase